MRERESNFNLYMWVIVNFFNCIVHMHELYTSVTYCHISGGMSWNGRIVDYCRYERL